MEEKKCYLRVENHACLRVLKRVLAKFEHSCRLDFQSDTEVGRMFFLFLASILVTYDFQTNNQDGWG